MAFKVLIVDGKDYDLELLQRNCEKQGHQVITAETGKKAFPLAQKELPDLILIGLELTDTDSFDLCNKIRLEISAFKPPIIILFGRQEKEKLNGRLLTCGADDYVEVGFDPNILCSRFSEMLSERMKHAV